MRIKPAAVLLAIDALSALLIAFVVVFPARALQIAPGVPFAVFFPGYALLAALFPSMGSLTISRLILSCGLSKVIVVFTGFLLNYSGRLTFTLCSSSHLLSSSSPRP